MKSKWIISILLIAGLLVVGKLLHLAGAHIVFLIIIAGAILYNTLKYIWIEQE